jgi:hypothetical protein
MKKLLGKNPLIVSNQEMVHRIKNVEYTTRLFNLSYAITERSYCEGHSPRIGKDAHARAALAFPVGLLHALPYFVS